MTQLQWVILLVAQRSAKQEPGGLFDHIWLIVAGVVMLGLIGGVALWLRMPVFRWYCRHCKKVIGTGRLHPAKCTCGTKTLVAYFCRDCSSWNTTPTPGWHCNRCSSKDVILGVEYSLGTALWRWRNRPT
jgi:hypothetical protein